MLARLAAPRDFSFRNTVASHGWSALAPFSSTSDRSAIATVVADARRRRAEDLAPGRRPRGGPRKPRPRGGGRAPGADRGGAARAGARRRRLGFPRGGARRSALRLDRGDAHGAAPPRAHGVRRRGQARAHHQLLMGVHQADGLGARRSGTGSRRPTARARFRRPSGSRACASASFEAECAPGTGRRTWSR